MPMPYVGEFRGATWSMRALFARDGARQDLKWQWVNRVLAQHDFLAVQETHSTPGFVHTAALPREAVCWWAHDSQQAGGIGLLVSRSFLAGFAPTLAADWTILEPGRLARLCLRGALGSLHLYVMYMSTGDGARAERDATRQRLAVALASPDVALSVVMGDFNYAAPASIRHGSCPPAGMA